MKHPSGFTLADFESHVSDHVMSVDLDSGNHRSLLFAAPDSSNRWFQIVTWNESLSFSGDMGSFTFSRIIDMFQFFRSESGELNVNPSYWSEKVQSVDRDDGMKTFYGDCFLSFLSGLVEDGYLDESTRLEMVEEWDGEENTAYDLCSEHDLFDHEPDFRDFTYRYLWCIHAIVWGIREYDNALKYSHPLHDQVLGRLKRGESKPIS